MRLSECHNLHKAMLRLTHMQGVAHSTSFQLLGTRHLHPTQRITRPAGSIETVVAWQTQPKTAMVQVTWCSSIPLVTAMVHVAPQLLELQTCQLHRLLANSFALDQGVSPVMKVVEQAGKWTQARPKESLEASMWSWLLLVTYINIMILASIHSRPYGTSESTLDTTPSKIGLALWAFPSWFLPGLSPAESSDFCTTALPSGLFSWHVEELVVEHGHLCVIEHAKVLDVALASWSAVLDCQQRQEDYLIQDILPSKNGTRYLSHTTECIISAP